jgi:rhamnosyltransferase
MLNEYMLHAQRDMVAIVTQRQVEQGTGRDRTLRCAQDGGPVDAITSGSLMPIAIFDQCGWFDEQLIIDGVDYEYCLRARSLGYTLVKCWRAVLLVSVGSVRRHQILGWKVNASHHSTARRYYMTRNKLVVVHRFWRRNPAWCYRAIRDMAKDTIKIVLFEDERWRKLRNTARGIIDALNGRMGKVVEL